MTDPLDQPEDLADERGPVGWQRSTNQPVIRALEAAGIHGERLLVAIQELLDARVLVSKGYYIPTFDDLHRDYYTLGEAYLKGRINVRWVMCTETRDALAARYAERRYASWPDGSPSWWSDVKPSAEVLATEVRTMMERARRWEDTDRLFGIPIRLDPVARKPVFEIIPQAERDHG